MVITCSMPAAHPVRVAESWQGGRSWRRCRHGDAAVMATLRSWRRCGLWRGGRVWQGGGLLGRGPRGEAGRGARGAPGASGVGAGGGGGGAGLGAGGTQGEAGLGGRDRGGA